MTYKCGFIVYVVREKYEERVKEKKKWLRSKLDFKGKIDNGSKKRDFNEAGEKRIVRVYTVRSGGWRKEREIWLKNVNRETKRTRKFNL